VEIVDGQRGDLRPFIIGRDLDGVGGSSEVVERRGVLGISGRRWLGDFFDGDFENEFDEDEAEEDDEGREKEDDEEEGHDDEEKGEEEVKFFPWIVP